MFRTPQHFTGTPAFEDNASSHVAFDDDVDSLEGVEDDSESEDEESESEDAKLHSMISGTRTLQ